MTSLSSLQNDRILRALLRQPVDITPVWVMRQAGRYLPEYRAVRARAGSFMTLCQTPELACEVTLQPLVRFDLDAAIIFSDILTIPDAMGLGLSFIEGQGPVFQKPVRSARDVASLGVPDPETDLRYVGDALRLVRRELQGKVPLIGFCGSPWTMACYMVEGGADKQFSHIRAMQRECPAVLHTLLDLLARAVTAHLNAQIHAGAQVVMIFDTWGGMLEGDDYQAFSLTYISQIMQELTREHEGRIVPRILYARSSSQWIEDISRSGCDAVGVDWQITLQEARRRTQGRVALQGNMDPALMTRTPDEIRAGVSRILSEYGGGVGHVFNLGHGITPDVPPEHMGVLVDAVHELSRGHPSQANHRDT